MIMLYLVLFGQSMAGMVLTGDCKLSNEHLLDISVAGLFFLGEAPYPYVMTGVRCCRFCCRH